MCPARLIETFSENNRIFSWLIKLIFRWNDFTAWMSGQSDIYRWGCSFSISKYLTLRLCHVGKENFM